MRFSETRAGLVGTTLPDFEYQIYVVSLLRRGLSIDDSRVDDY